MSARQDGFTLVEVLIALFIFALISTGAFVALATTLDARDAAQARLSEVERLTAMRRLMGDDIAHWARRPNRDALGDFSVAYNPADPVALRLTRRGRPNPAGTFARGDLLRVHWHVDGGRLVRSVLAHENPAQNTPTLDRVVLDGVEAMEVRYVASQADVDRIVQSVAQLEGGDLSAFDINSRQGGASDIGVIDVTLTHADGTTTRHLFESRPL